MSKPPVDFFTQELAERYDERNKKLSAISENLHFLIGLILDKLPAKARILSVGAGTGAEILSLAKAYPHWSFVAVEPSLAMLNVCKNRLAAAGISDRCEFVHGTAEDLKASADFDAVLSVLVAHFVKAEDRLDFLKNHLNHLKPSGVFITAEISFDLMAGSFVQMLNNWESVQKLMGATPEALAALPKQLKEVLTVLSPEKTEKLLVEAGIKEPIRFFQSFMIHGWYGFKN